MSCQLLFLDIISNSNTVHEFGSRFCKDTRSFRFTKFQLTILSQPVWPASNLNPLIMIGVGTPSAIDPPAINTPFLMQPNALSPSGVNFPSLFTYASHGCTKATETVLHILIQSIPDDVWACAVWLSVRVSIEMAIYKIEWSRYFH